MNRDYPLAPTSEPEPINDRKKKTIEERISDIDNNKRLNRRVERRYENYDNKKEKSKDNPEKIKKIEKKYGYNYDAAIKSGGGPNESKHWGSIEPNTGMVLKAKNHPSIMKTRKTERILGNKIIKKDGERYSVSKKKNN